MIFIISWNSFIQRTANQNIYVHEFDDRWEVYAVMSSAETVKSVILKNDEVEQNMMFVDKYFANNPNALKIIAYEHETPNIIIKPQAEVTLEKEEAGYEPEDMLALGLGEIKPNDRRIEEE